MIPSFDDDEIEIAKRLEREAALRAWRRQQATRNRHKLKKLFDMMPYNRWDEIGNWERKRRRRVCGYTRETYDQRYATRSERHRAKRALRRGEQPPFDREIPLD